MEARTAVLNPEEKPGTNKADTISLVSYW